MNDPEARIRDALRDLLGGLQPRPGIPPTTLVRARRRRGWTAAALLATAACAVVATWTVVAARDPADPPRPATVRSGAGPHLYLTGKYGRIWRVSADGTVVESRVRELDPGDPPNHVLRRGRSLVGWGYETYLLDPELEEAPQVIASDSLFFLASAHEDRIWVATEAPGTNRRIASVREMTIDGRVTVPPTKPPGRRWPSAAVADGLVFYDGDDWIVWDPVTRETRFRFDAEDLGPTHGNLVTWCGSFCHDLEVTDVRTGEVTSVPPPEGFGGYEVWRGEFSPDGKTIAVPVQRDKPHEAELALVDVESGTATTVEGTRTPDYFNFGVWSADGGHVFFAGMDLKGSSTIHVYRLGSEAARRLDVDVGRFYDAAAL